MGTAAGLVGLALWLSASPAAAGVVIAVDRTTQTMRVAVDGTARWVWRVSTGVPGHGTPAGRFRVLRLEEMHYSRTYDNAPMPHSIFFTRFGHAIHGTGHVRQLGSPASHGCVRLAKKNAAALYRLVGGRRSQVEIVISGEARHRGKAADAHKAHRMTVGRTAPTKRR